MNRPFAVTLLAIVAVVAGLIAVMDVAALPGNLLPVAALGELNFFGTQYFRGYSWPASLP
jgi:hypothetical protein